MERDFAGARLSAESYRKLATMCQGDRRFPARYEDWETLVREGTRQALADGRPSNDVIIDVDEFLAWCRKVAILPGFDALRAYLIISRRSAELLQGQQAASTGAKPFESHKGGRGEDHAKRAALRGAALLGMLEAVLPGMRACPVRA